MYLTPMNPSGMSFSSPTKLVLCLTGGNELVAPSDRTRTLVRQGCLIGRSPAADWALPDPKRYLSKKHLLIDWQDNAYLLKDISTNGVYLNSWHDRVQPGEQIELKDGDVIHAGHFCIRVQVLPLEDDGWHDPNPHLFASAPCNPCTAQLPSGLSGSAEVEWYDNNIFFEEGRSPEILSQKPAAPEALARETTEDFRRNTLDDLMSAPLETPQQSAPSFNPAGTNTNSHQTRPLPQDLPITPQTSAEPEEFAHSAWDHTPLQSDVFNPPRIKKTIIPEDWDAGLDLTPAPRGRKDGL